MNVIHCIGPTYRVHACSVNDSNIIIDNYLSRSVNMRTLDKHLGFCMGYNTVKPIERSHGLDTLLYNTTGMDN